MILKCIPLLVIALTSPLVYAACDQTLSPGANIVNAVANAPAGSTICLNSGNYGTVPLYNISRSGFVTLQSVSGKGAIMSPQVGNTTYVKFVNMTLTTVLVDSCSKHVHFIGTDFVPHKPGLAFRNDSTCVGSQDYLVDGANFTQVAQHTWEGRLNLVGVNGAVIKNSIFSGISSTSGSGPSDGIQVLGGTTNSVIGPNNIFRGIDSSQCLGVHCDSIQDYGGGPGNSIIGNYFYGSDVFIMMPDGSSNYTVMNNVFDGRSSDYWGKIQFGSAANPVFRHNTLINLGVALDSKPGNPATSNAQVQNNILLQGSGFKTTNGNGCSNCNFSSNMFDPSSEARGTNNIIGTPVFVGGSALTNLAGYKLASTSLGLKAASDGMDMGTNYYGDGSIVTPPAPSELLAPSNLRYGSLGQDRAELQWDYAGNSQSGFTIYEKRATDAYRVLTDAKGADRMFLVTGLTASTKYCYTIEAYNPEIKSAKSNEVCLTTLAAPTPTPDPTPTPVSGESLLGSSTPEILSENDGVTYELGMKFKSLKAGKISAIRFYKSPSESGIHTGKIYSSTGALLASATFTSESASGWQQVSLASPLSIAANTIYVVAVNTGNNYYVSTVNGLSISKTSANLQSIVGSNGVYGPAGSMPKNSWNNSNYFRDVVFNADAVVPAPVSENLLGTSAPASLGNRDGVNYELGMKFRTLKAGKITAIRFYKSPSESGTHTGKIYSSSGSLLASVKFTNESASGWQTMVLSGPLNVAANTIYVVAVNTGKQYYGITVGGLATAKRSANLETVVGANGVYGPVGKMPTNSFQNSNYFRDVTFIPNP